MNTDTYRKVYAQNLPFKDNSFDCVLVHAGLHHCQMPHKALCEMYRVAKKRVLDMEAQDSLVVRIFAKLGFLLDYETDAIDKGSGMGGVNCTSVPNYVIRWTKREVEKTISSYDPEKEPNIEFKTKFVFYPIFLNDGMFLSKNPFIKMIGLKNTEYLFDAGVILQNIFFKNEGNQLFFMINKDGN